MSLTGVLDVLLDERSGEPALRAAVEAARSGARTDLDLTAPPGIRPFALAALAARAGRPVLAVTATGREAEELATALRDLLEPDAVVEFPAWETLPHERLSPRSDTVGRRLAVLRRLAHPDAEDVGHGSVQVGIRVKQSRICAGGGGNIAECEGSRFILKDLNSTNGTLLNGNPVTEIDLHPGDVIEMGEMQLEFVAGLPS